MAPYILRLDDEAWEEWNRAVEALYEVLSVWAEQMAETARIFSEFLAPDVERWYLTVKRLEFEDRIACTTGSQGLALWISCHIPDWVILKLP